MDCFTLLHSAKHSFRDIEATTRCAQCPSIVVHVLMTHGFIISHLAAVCRFVFGSLDRPQITLDTVLPM